MNLSRSFEAENGIIGGEYFLPDSILKDGYTVALQFNVDDEIAFVTVYNSATQVDANKVARSSYNYDSNRDIQSVEITYYKEDGLTPEKVETYTYTITDDTLTGAVANA